MRARFFEAADAERWDDFCARSYCATFLHTRRFLSYHGERFVDRSLILEDQGDWVGLLPVAQRQGEPSIVGSHPGITFGGFVHKGKLRGGEMMDAFREVAALLQTAGYSILHYKALPYIYQLVPAQDDLYALFRCGANLWRRDLSSCVDLAHRLPPNPRRRRALKAADKASVTVTVGQGRRVRELWRVVEDNLERRHELAPTHSFDEICLLAERFPNNIRFMVALAADEVVAGVVLFLMPRVAHAQYIGSSDRVREVHALDRLLESVIVQAAEEGRRFFDFGNSNENQGRYLNPGLIRFKNEFGSGGVTYDFFELDLRRCLNAIE